MKVLMIGGSPYSTFMTLGAALLSSLVKNRGYQYEYFDLCDYDFAVEEEHKLGEAQLEYKKVAQPLVIPRKPREDAMPDLLNLVESYQPDIIGLSTTTGEFCFGASMMRQIKARFPDIPMIVGGVHPTVDSEGVIKEDFVDIINVGQGEQSFLELLDGYVNNKTWDTTIKNMWFKMKDGQIIRNPLREPLQDLDWLPYPDWDIYKSYHFYRPFVGNYYRIGTIEISRGCPLICTYCINSFLPVLTGVHNYVTKSVDRVIEEMVFLKEKHGINFIRFLDEIFLLKELPYLEELADKYVKHVNLPFIISTTASSVTEENVKILKRMGCVNVGLGLETGDEELRRTVLKKKIPDSHYERAYKLINEQGIRSTAQIMFGLPGETRDTFIKAIRLVREWKVDTAHIAIFYPFKGTALRDYSIEQGLLDPTEIEEFEKDRYISTRIVRTLLKFDEEHVRWMEYYKRYFTVYKETPEWLWPLIDECAKEDDFSERLTGILRELVSKKRFASDTVAIRESDF